MTACDCNLFRGDDGPVAVAGDNYGRVRLFRYPSTSSFCCSKLYWASSNPITRLKLTCGDSVLLTLSGKDKSIMQWSLSRDRDDAVAHDVVSRSGARPLLPHFISLTTAEGGVLCCAVLL